MPFTREDIRESVERAGDAHWKALRDHHEDAYPASRPTPGDVCKAEAERLNEMGLGDAKEFELVETRVERVGDKVRLTHVFTYKRLRLSVPPQHASRTARARLFEDMHRGGEPFEYSRRAAEVLRHRFISDLVRALAPRPARLLDVGCSEGQLTLHLAAMPEIVVAVDLSRAA